MFVFIYLCHMLVVFTHRGKLVKNRSSSKHYETHLLRL